MIDLEFRSQATPPEEFLPCRSGMLAIASFIIHYLGWQAAISFGARCSSLEASPSGRLGC
jgi:hypothetical protein